MNKPTDSYINSIGTSVPAYTISQEQSIAFMTNVLELDDRESRRLRMLYRQTMIDQRHSVLRDYVCSPEDFTFYPNSPGLEPFPSVSQRMQVYRQTAVPLAAKAVENCLRRYPDFDQRSITHLIVVSCTGLYAPGPDIELIDALGLSGTTQRLAINFMGCYGAFNGLKVADSIVRANLDAHVLVVCVELCTLHFQKKLDTDQLLSNALFADGAAAVLVESRPRPEQAFRLRSFYCDLLPEGKHAMAWHISDFGFEMTLTAEVPSFIQQGISQLMGRLLHQSNLTQDEIGFYALHPGGRRILEVIEQQLGLSTYHNRYAYDVLRQNGNMSSATVLFVLNAIWQDLATGDVDADPEQSCILSCAFGPGLTLESMILETVIAEPAYARSIRSSAVSLVS